MTCSSIRSRETSTPTMPITRSGSATSCRSISMSSARWRAAYGRGRACPGPDVVVLCVAQRLADPQPRRLLEHGVAEGDVGEAEATMPEQDGLVVARPPRLGTADDLAELAMQRRLGQFSRLDMGTQATEHAALALAQSSTTSLSMMSVTVSSIALIVP